MQNKTAPFSDQVRTARGAKQETKKERERERVDGEIHGHFEILRVKEKRQERRTSHVGPANADRPSGDQRGEDSRMRKASERRMTDDKETPGDADERELERQKGNKEAGTREKPK